MPRILQAVLVCFGALASSALPAAAQNYPFCIKGCDFGAGRGDCSFSSYQQCSGRDAYCDVNPQYNANAELQPDRSRPSRRRF
jgi:hypothetical protein